MGGSAVRTVGLLIQLVVIARFCGAEQLGVYSFALALTTPIVLTFGWHLRVMLAVDAHHRYAWSAYRRLRTWSLLFAGVVLGLVCVLWSTANVHFIILMLVYAVKSSEALSELGYGMMQRVGDTKAIGIGNSIRGVAATFAIAIPLMFGARLEIAVVCQAIASGLVYLLVEMPRVSRFSQDWHQGSDSSLALLKTVWPLGISLGFTAFAAGAPRLVLTQFGLVTEAGAFLIIISLMMPASILVTSLQQTYGARMADAVRAQNQVIWKRHLRYCIAVGYGSVFVMAIFGWFALMALPLMLGWNVDVSLSAFAAMACAAAIQTHQNLLGTGLDSTGNFHVKLMLYIQQAVVVYLLSWLLIPAHGLGGAFTAMLISAFVSLGLTWIVVQRSNTKSFRALP